MFGDTYGFMMFYLCNAWFTKHPNEHANKYENVNGKSHKVFAICNNNKHCLILIKLII